MLVIDNRYQRDSGHSSAAGRLLDFNLELSAYDNFSLHIAFDKR
jgi:hypothetical protein